VFYAIHPKEVTRFLQVANFSPAVISGVCAISGPTAPAYVFPVLYGSLALAASSLWFAYRRQIPAVVVPLTAVAKQVSRVAEGAFGKADRAIGIERGKRTEPSRDRGEKVVTLTPKAAGPEFVVDRGKLDNGQTLVIGRSRGSDVVLSHESVSRRHACIWLDKAGVLWIEDLGSSTGTFVGNERVSGKKALPAEAHVRFGAVGYTLHLEQSA
jgi:hypothetical protein